MTSNTSSASLPIRDSTSVATPVTRPPGRAKLVARLGTKLSLNAGQTIGNSGAMRLMVLVAVTAFASITCGFSRISTRRTVVDIDIAAFDVAEALQSFPEGREVELVIFW